MAETRPSTVSANGQSQDVEVLHVAPANEPVSTRKEKNQADVDRLPSELGSAVHHTSALSLETDVR